MDGINNLLKVAGTDLEAITSMVEECGGLDKIESLQNHENVEIYKLAYEIIEHYFSEEVCPINSSLRRYNLNLTLVSVPSRRKRTRIWLPRWRTADSSSTLPRPMPTPARTSRSTSKTRANASPVKSVY